MFIGYYNVANFITLLGLACAIISSAFSINGDFRGAVVFLILASVSDMMDGPVARRLKRSDMQKTFGVQIDTVCDVVSFGVAPAIMGYCLGLKGFFVIVLIFYAACGAIRLAYFNTLAIHADAATGYKGVPIPAVAFALPLVMWLKLVLSPTAFMWALTATFAVLGFLFILNVDIKKPKGAVFIVLPVLEFTLLVSYLIWGALINK